MLKLTTIAGCYSSVSSLYSVMQAEVAATNRYASLVAEGKNKLTTEMAQSFFLEETQASSTHISQSKQVIGPRLMSVEQ